jgi:ferredoxin-nitrite reductase
MGKGLDLMSVETAICPDIYHPAVARDGLLTRLRIPGGVLNVEQCLSIEHLLASTGLASVQVTNRANLQLRGLDRDLGSELIANLTAVGLAAATTAVDGIRNLMTSPTAGIDATELIDVRPVVAAWDEYLTAHPELGALSNKFSVGFDGGGSVSILDRPNDITLLAVSAREFLLHLAMGERGDAPVSVGVRLGLDECVPMLGSIAQAYLLGCEGFAGRKKPRLREVIEVVEGELLRSGVYLTQRFALVGFPDVRSESATHRPGGNLQVVCVKTRQRGTEEAAGGHLGVWRQKQVGLSYVGVVLPLGRWTLEQVRGLSAIASQYGSGSIRLTPWQNAIVPDIPDADVAKVQRLIEGLGLSVGANHLNGLLTACAGASGCQFGATDTQGDALALSAYLESKFQLDQPLNIHVSGCDKSCAQHYQADIALWGCPATVDRSPGYRLCVSGGAERFGRELTDYLAPGDVKRSIESLIRTYREQRASPHESFRTFTARQSLAQLQQVLHAI